MPATTIVRDTPQHAASQARGLWVAWQHPFSRAYDLVGRLDVPTVGAGSFRFRYFERAASVAGFQPFVDLPDLDRVYESDELFALFDNRLTPRSRADYPALAASVGLGGDADPFEVLARTGGRRATDTVEVVAEPVIDIAAGTLSTDFLVHGVSHHPGVDVALGHLSPGDRLRVLCDVQNPVDPLSLALADPDTRNLGWVPRYLSPLVRRSADRFGWADIEVSVLHVGDPTGPAHLRLLASLRAPWDPDDPVLDDSSRPVPLLAER